MKLPDYLLVLESRARLAFAITDDAASDDEVQAFRDDLGVEVGEHAHDTAEDFLHSGYAFTPELGSPVVAILSAGGPDVRLVRDGDDYALTAYAPGHRDVELTSEAITRWGHLIDAQHTA